MMQTTATGVQRTAPQENGHLKPREAAEPPPTVKFAIRGLNFFYGQHHALKAVNAEIRQHEITALIGPSGCGKSTFLRVLNRMNELLPNTKTEGSVVMDGVDLYDRRVDVVELRKR